VDRDAAAASVAHPRVGTGGGGAPRASSPTFMGFFDVKERSEERLLGAEADLL
jgi:hypothetical protein